MLSIAILHHATGIWPAIPNPKEIDAIYNGRFLPDFPEYCCIIAPYNIPEGQKFIFFALDYLAIAGRRYPPEIFSLVNLGQFNTLFIKYHDLFKIKKGEGQCQH